MAEHNGEALVQELNIQLSGGGKRKTRGYIRARAIMMYTDGTGELLLGLLLKHLYQNHGAIPIQVVEGVAILWAAERPSYPASPLPETADQVWKDFQNSDLAKEALRDGIEATLSAMGKTVGAVALTDSLAAGSLLQALLDILPRYERKFQAQGGMRLDFFLKKDIDEWQRDLGVSKQKYDSVESIWKSALDESNAKTVPNKIASLLLDEALRDTSKPMTFRSVVGLWRGEGTGNARKKGRKDSLGWKPKRGWKDSEISDEAQQVDSAVESALTLIDHSRQGTRKLDQWVEHKLNCYQAYTELINSILQAVHSGLKAPDRKKAAEISVKSVLDHILNAWQNEALVPFINPKQIRAALRKTLANLLAWQLARQIDASNVAIFDWPVTILKKISMDKRFTVRFIKKTKTPDAKKIVEVSPLGAVVRLPERKTSIPAPFTVESLTTSGAPAIPSVSLPSRDRCIVCGSDVDLIGGTKSFLPESKKRWYESPTSFVEPKLCSNCAFVAYLSTIYPSDDTTIAEFPADNFLELFALHEHLQGVSGMVALKVLNRVATLSVLPSRYLLLSKTTKTGKMDSKTQVYAQLRNHIPLLTDLEGPMRVQVEGSQPSFWSEIHPHVAIGLSHFARFPGAFETGDRKVLAQRVTRALVDGCPFTALYFATQAQQPEKGFGWERNILTKGVRIFETKFVREKNYAAKLAHALGGENMKSDFYEDVIDFSNYLLDLVRPLVQREVKDGGSAVSGISRKYTDLITRDFSEGRAAKFLYAVCQEADSAERDGAGWAKWRTFETLYGDRPAVEGKSGEEAAKLWSKFRDQHPKTALETRICELQEKHGESAGLWSKFLGEVQARTLALLMLNVRNVSTR